MRRCFKHKKQAKEKGAMIMQEEQGRARGQVAMLINKHSFQTSLCVILFNCLDLTIFIAACFN